jgi:hypothetical protein
MSAPFGAGETVRIRSMTYSVVDCFAADGGIYAITVRDEAGGLRSFDILRDASDTTWLTERGDEVELVTEPVVDDPGQGDLFGGGSVT